jgi:hypothetical protein
MVVTCNDTFHTPKPRTLLNFKIASDSVEFHIIQAAR